MKKILIQRVFFKYQILADISRKQTELKNTKFSYKSEEVGQLFVVLLLYTAI